MTSGAALVILSFFSWQSLRSATKPGKASAVKLLSELAELYWTHSLGRNLHVKVEITACCGAFLQPCRHWIWRMDLTVAPKYILGSAAQVLLHTPGSGRTVLPNFLLLHMLSESPWTLKIDMWLIFPTNCLQGLLLSWVIRHVPALFHCLCCRAEMAVQHFHNHLEFKKSNDREERKGRREAGEEGDTSSVSTRIHKAHAKPSFSSQSTIRQQQTRGGVW